MKLELEYLPSNTFSSKEQQAFIDAVIPLLYDSNKVKIIITGDWIASLTEHAIQETSSSPMVRENAIGTALSDKNTEESYIILVKHPLPDGSDQTRNILHEALHVANRQRGEDMHTFGIDTDFSVQERWYSNLAGIMVEEYRVEKALAEAKNMNNGRIPDFTKSLDNLFESLVAGNPDAVWNTSLFNEILSCFKNTTYLLSHVTASKFSDQDIYNILDICPEITSSSLKPMLNLLLGLPSALEETDRDVLQDVAMGITQLIRVWGRELGFELKGKGSWDFKGLCEYEDNEDE